MQSRDPLKTNLDGLITVEHAAHILGVSGMTVRRMVAKGGLHPWRQLGRLLVSQPEVERMKRQREAK